MRVADLEARPATLDDAAAVADLASAVDPDDPLDPLVNRYRWKVAAPWPRERFVIEHAGQAVGFAYHEHAPWADAPDRYAYLGAFLAPDAFTPERMAAAYDLVEARSRAGGARTFTTWLKDKDRGQIAVLLGRGYREDRRGKGWELDLVANHEKLAEMARQSRTRMPAEGIRLLTLAEDGDPDAERGLWAVWDESRQDVPTTVPHPPYPFEHWRKWLSKPGIQRDRIWIARDGDGIVGVSALSYPPVRGNVWTDYTGTARRVRGRGIARALKLETVMQAIALGTPRVRTGNDGANAPILHLNEQLGYQQFGSGIQFLKQA